MQRKTDFIDLSLVSYLIVDRSASVRDSLAKTLRNFSATDVRETPNVEVAEAMIRDRLPEIIFLGLASGRTGEIDFLRALRRGANPPSRYIPAIILYEAVCVEETAAAIRLGADGFIAIPFSLAIVEANLLKVLHDSRSMHAD
jgi:DNA-binding NtrC family response regulator